MELILGKVISPQYNTAMTEHPCLLVEIRKGIFSKKQVVVINRLGIKTAIGDLVTVSKDYYTSYYLCEQI